MNLSKSSLLKCSRSLETFSMLQVLCYFRTVPSSLAVQHWSFAGVPSGLLSGSPRRSRWQTRQEQGLLPHVLHSQRPVRRSELSRRKCSKSRETVCVGSQDQSVGELFHNVIQKEQSTVEYRNPNYAKIRTFLLSNFLNEFALFFSKKPNKFC